MKKAWNNPLFIVRNSFKVFSKCRSCPDRWRKSLYWRNYVYARIIVWKELSYSYEVLKRRRTFANLVNQQIHKHYTRFCQACVIIWIRWFRKIWKYYEVIIIKILEFRKLCWWFNETFCSWLHHLMSWYIRLVTLI